jgi:hypothetical protein
MKTIVPNINSVDGSINIKDLVDKHFDDIQNYGDKLGWPINIAVLKKDDNQFSIIDKDTSDSEKILCNGTVHKQFDKNQIVKELSSKINFLT